jgi:hypothetical protein
MVIEIKRGVNANLVFVATRKRTQTLLECMYCLQQHNTTQVIGCLTDVTTWHFLNCKSMDSSDAMLSVNGSTTIVVTDNNYDILGHHLAQMMSKAIEVQSVCVLCAV